VAIAPAWIRPCARGECLIGCPLPNSSIEQWRLVVTVTGYTLFVTSQYDVVFTFAKQRFGEVVLEVGVQGVQAHPQKF